MDYSEMMMHGAAGLQGLSQGVMSPRAAQRFNAGAGGYQDLAKRGAWSDSLNERRLETQMVGGDDDAARKYAELRSRRPSLGAQMLNDPNKGLPPKKEGGGMEGMMKGASTGMSMMGMGGGF